MKHKTLLFLFSFSSLFISPHAIADNFFQKAGDAISMEWNNSMNGDNELYIPALTWHNRATYDHHKIDEFNERPWGLGFGKGYKHEDGDWSGFYAMTFKDSHNDWQPIAGYGYTKNFYTENKNWHVGVGYTVFLTSRKDIMNYIPFPGVLPLISTGYKNLIIQGTYIPGGKNNGNVAFAWLKYTF